MESSRNRLKSLKDTLLEYAVLNMDFFLTIPIFPRDLFDGILEKSKDMCWPIETEHLITERDKLNWSDKSCFRNVDKFWPSDLEVFASSVHDLKILKLRVDLKRLTDVNIFREISQTTKKLEDLDLKIVMHDEFINDFPIDSDSAYSKEVKAKIGTLTPLKLKRLRLKVVKFEFFPCTLDPNKLTVFDLYRCTLTETFFKMLVGFKGLSHLSLYRSEIEGVSLGNVIDAVTTLKNLQFLNMNMWQIGEYVDEIMLNKIMENIEKLDILELAEISLKKPNQLLTRKRKLKALNYHYLITSNINEIGVFSRLAHRIGNYTNLEGLMTIISTTPTRKLYFGAVDCLFDLINRKRLCYKVLIKDEKRGIFNFRSPLRLDETFQSKVCSYDLMTRMICYRVNSSTQVGRFFVNRWIRDFVECNEDTHLAERFIEYLPCSD